MDKENKKQTSQSVATNPAKNERFDIAKQVLIFGLVAVSVLGLIAIIFSSIWGERKEVFTDVKDILTMLLPMIGAWVGTILAFYFSKDNFKQASDSTREIFQQFTTSKEKLATIRVGDVMIKLDDMVKLNLSKDEGSINLMTDIIDGIMEKDKNKPINRLPVLNEKMYPIYLIHRSLFDKFFVKMALNNKILKDLTLSDMSKDDDFKNIMKNSFGTIRENSNLAEVKNQIDNVSIYQDVFVTETGDPNSKVIGWVTNVMVAEKSVLS
jgi:hypothetical protein